MQFLVRFFEFLTVVHHCDDFSFSQTELWWTKPVVDHQTVTMIFLSSKPASGNALNFVVVQPVDLNAVDCRRESIFRHASHHGPGKDRFSCTKEGTNTHRDDVIADVWSTPAAPTYRVFHLSNFGLMACFSCAVDV